MSETLTIAEQVAYCVARIECDLAGGGRSTGSGFFFDFVMKDGQKVPTFITNRHVIAGAEIVRFRLCAASDSGEPLDRQHIGVGVDRDHQRMWIGHPDPAIDLVAIPIASLFKNLQLNGQRAFHKSFDHNLIPTSTEFAALSPLEEVVMVGYPVGIWDALNNQPIFRRGVAATHPAKDYEGRPEFMIDLACFPGSSGSPVLLLNQGGYATRKGITLGVRFKLLGVLYAGPQYTAQGDLIVEDIPAVQIPRSQTQIPTNLGLVIRANALLEFGPLLQAIVDADPRSN